MSSRTFQLPQPVQDWLIATTVHEHEALVGLRAATARVSMSQMQISPEQGAFMAWLVKTLGVRTAVEVGTYTGYSALSVALALPPDGHLVCCDISEEWTAVGRPYWMQAGVLDRIDLRIGPALQTLEGMIGEGRHGTYDFAFIDADKVNYLEYYELCLRLVRVGGVIALDNTLWSGRLADANEQGESTVALRKVVEQVSADPRVRSSLVPIGDGLLLATRLR